MIKEEEITRILNLIGGDEDGTYLQQFAKTHGQYVHYLTSDTFNILLPHEKEVLIFTNLVIFLALDKSGEGFEFEVYSKHEESNWSVSGLKSESMSWGQKLDKFFENFPEEELLSFVEDMTIDDGENEMSDLGRECIFITAKSYIDYLTHQND